MKREIKFRAWSHRDKCWCGAFAVHKDGLWRESPNNEWTDLAEQEDIVLMQFTGLLDKNDIEIYEGDLIGFDGVYGEVLWFNSGWQVGDGGMLHVIVDKCDVTVLGNIFQNPKQHE